MSRVAVTFAACLTLAACGGDGGTNPPPPAVNQVASLTRTDSSVLQFTGKKVAIRDLFVAKDAAGAVVPSAHLSCATPTGFTYTGDSLIAPTVEARGKLRCSATTVSYMLAPGQSGAQRLAAADPADSLTVTAGIDLQSITWRIHWRCTGGDALWDQLGGTRADSVDYDGRIAEWLYPGETGAVRSNFGDVASLTVTPTITLYKSDAVAWQGDGPPYPYASAERQAVDTLFLVLNVRSYARDTLVRVNGSTPRVYTGANFCDEEYRGYEPLGPVTLEEVTP